MRQKQIFSLIAFSCFLFYGKAEDNHEPSPNKSSTGWGEPSNFHPLDPLTEYEIYTTTSIINQFSRLRNPVFSCISLQEPEKYLLLPYFLQDKPLPTNIPRRSFASVYDPDHDTTYEAIVNLDSNRVESWSDTNGVRANIRPGGFDEAEKIAKADRNVIERCRKMGWNDMNLVTAQSGAMRHVEDKPEYKGKWIRQVFMDGRNFPIDNHYVHPFDFLVIVDLNSKKVIDIQDIPTHSDFSFDKRGNNVPRQESNYDPAALPPDYHRTDVRPAFIVQPFGVSYRVNGNEVLWQKFKFRIGFNPREGPILYHISYKDGQEVRPLFYRISVAEMYVPYGDARPPFNRKVVFDEGQDGIGFNMDELKAGVDCLGQIYFFDEVIHDVNGIPKRLRNSICMMEEDAGVLWKHTDGGTGRSPTVRSQRLSLSFIATVGNYDYIFSWFFYQDATIELNVKATGIVSTNLLAENSKPAPYGAVEFPQTYCIYHQHFITLRIDAEIDGNKNTVALSEAVPSDAPTGSAENPWGNGFVKKVTVLKTAGEARTNTNVETRRGWLIQNGGRLNPYQGVPVAWKLIPWENQKPLRRKDSPLYAQSAFQDYSVWVTKYEEGQLFPGGFYLNGSGLVEWVGREPNKNIVNEDIVLWYNFGFTHLPRTEDFPVMPVEGAVVYLKPHNFFNQNPAIDVPPPIAAQFKDEL